jgi:hypothetical protein
MQLHTTLHDLPSSYDVTTFIHNEFVGLLKKFKDDLTVCSIFYTGSFLSITKACYIGITGHWIKVKDLDWQLHSEVLAFSAISGSHTGENYACYFLKLGKQVCLFTDTSQVRSIRNHFYSYLIL